MDGLAVPASLKSPILLNNVLGFPIHTKNENFEKDYTAIVHVQLGLNQISSF